MKTGEMAPFPPIAFARNIMKCRKKTCKKKIKPAAGAPAINAAYSAILQNQLQKKTHRTRR